MPLPAILALLFRPMLRTTLRPASDNSGATHEERGCRGLPALSVLDITKTRCVATTELQGAGDRRLAGFVARGIARGDEFAAAGDEDDVGLVAGDRLGCALDEAEAQCGVEVSSYPRSEPKWA
ncbi:hypothetical protein ACWEVP_17915 [Amycolatopsis sp. NPDC003865]